MAQSDLQAHPEVFPAPWVEAVILVTLAAVPIAISPFANSFAEGTKANLARHLGLALLLFLAGGLAAWLRGGGRLRLAAIDVAALLFISSMGLSTALAVNGGYAWSGSPGRGGGFLTLLAQGAILAGAAITIRDLARVRRLVGAAVLGSLPCVLYGLLQATGADPLSVARTVFQGRIMSTFGNPIFFGSFLALVSPLTLWLAWESRRTGHRAAAAVWAVLFLLQAVALWLTGSRGPLLAWIGGMALGLLLALLRMGRRSLARRLAGLALLAVPVGLLAFHLLFILPFRGTQLPPPFDRATRIETVVTRLNIYRAVASRMSDSAPLRSTLGATDPLAAWRRWIGFGPQNLQLATEAHLPPALERLESDQAIIDTAHCRLMEVGIEAGWLGVLTWLGLFGAVLWAVLCATGLAVGPRQASNGVATVAATGVGGSVALALLWGGFAWVLGFAAGVVVGLLLLVRRASREPVGHDPGRAAGLLPVAVATSLAVFFLDAQSGVPTVAVGLVLWALLGVMRNAGRGCLADAAPTSGADEADAARAFPVLAMLAAVGLSTSLTMNPGFTPSAGRVLAAALGSGVTLCALAVCLAGALLGSLPAAPGRRGRMFLGGFALAGLVWSIHLAKRSLWMALLMGDRVQTADQAAELVLRLARWESLRYIWLAVGVVVVGWLLSSDRGQERRRAVLGAAALVCVALMLFLAWPRSGQTAARFEASAAYFSAEANRPDMAAQVLSHAVGRSAWDDYYHLAQYAAYGHLAERLSEPAMRDTTLMRALQSLEAAQRESPFDAMHAGRFGQLYQLWAAGSPDPASRRLLATEAVRRFDAALLLAPGRNSYRLSAAQLQLEILEDAAGAEQHLRTALRLDVYNARAAELLAYLCLHRAQEASPGTVRDEVMQEAAAFARTSLDSPWRRQYAVDANRLKRIAAVPGG